MKFNEHLPKYEQITNHLLEQIASGAFRYDEPFITEKKICDTYKVSRITAKRAITDLENRGLLYRKRGVGSFVTRNPSGLTSLQAVTTNNTSKTIAFLLPFDVSKGGLFDTVEATNRILGEKGYFLSIYISSPNNTKEKNTLKLLLDQQISGLVYYPTRDRINLDLLNEFIFQNKTVVVIDKDINCPYIQNIVSDNFHGGWLLAEHLHQLGHTNISFFTTAPIDSTSSVQGRFGGYLCYLQSQGIEIGTKHLVYYPHHLDEDTITTAEYERFRHYIRRQIEIGFTAFICENDQVAFFVQRACLELGVSIPEDVSICGFDNSKWSTDATIGITTVSQNFTYIGETIGKVLLNSLGNPKISVQKIVTPVDLIVRKSTGAVSKTTLR
jgi:DNA-binding LacI/PurR family transcriptional regulator